MTLDKQKVVLGLQCCDDLGSPDCERCPYMDDDLVGTCRSRNPLLKDALQLIEELAEEADRQYECGFYVGLAVGQAGCEDDD